LKKIERRRCGTKVCLCALCSAGVFHGPLTAMTRHPGDVGDPSWMEERPFMAA
jgi:hypothetical protein